MSKLKRMANEAAANMANVTGKQVSATTDEVADAIIKVAREFAEMVLMRQIRFGEVQAGSKAEAMLRNHIAETIKATELYE